VVDDLAVIPLYHQIHIWAMRKDLHNIPRMDEYTFLNDVHTVR